MRRRLLVSTLSVAVAAVLLLGVPLALVGNRLLRQEAQQRLTESAQRVAAAVDDRIENGRPLQPHLAHLVGAGRRVAIYPRSGPPVVAGPSPRAPVTTVTVALQTGGRLTVSASAAPVQARVLRAWLLVGGLTLASMAVAVLLAVWQSRRLVRPLEGLALAADRLGSGDTRPVEHSFGLPEVDHVAEVLDRTAGRISAELSRERQFAADASHQLRTPLTALSIRLEEISLAAEDPVAVRAESAAALAQVERLAGVVGGLLARARGNRPPARRIDVGELIAAQVREYLPAFRRAGRRVVVDARPGLVAAGSPGGVAQALSSLLDNALVHGSGTVTVGARPAAEHVVVEVGDQGAGVAEHVLPRLFEREVSGGSGTGLGLALARALVEADRGRLELVRAAPAVFAMFLPVAGPPGDVDGGEPPRTARARGDGAAAPTRPPTAPPVPEGAVGGPAARPTSARSSPPPGRRWRPPAEPGTPTA